MGYFLTAQEIAEQLDVSKRTV
nr:MULTISPECIES: HTH domain-containing protein [Acinetobacter]